MLNCRSFFAALLGAVLVTPVAAQTATAPAPAAPKPAQAAAPAKPAVHAKAHATRHAARHAEKADDKLKDVIYLDTKYGRTTIQMRPDLAPKNVAQVEKLTKEGFYNGLVFHRVIAGFMAQTGDPTGTGAGGSKLPNLPAEFTTKAHFLRGTVGMARTSDPNSANSQFFICYAPMPSLDGQYTIVGQVTSGMDAIDKIKKGTGANGMVVDPDKIVKMQLASESAPAKKIARKPHRTRKAKAKAHETSGAKPAAAAPTAGAPAASQSAPAH